MIMLEEKDKNKNKIRNDQNLNLNMHLNRDWYKEKFNPVTMISSCLQKWKDLLKICVMGSWWSAKLKVTMWDMRK